MSVGDEVEKELKSLAKIDVIFPKKKELYGVKNREIKFMVDGKRLPVTNFTISPGGERNIAKLNIDIDPAYFEIKVEGEEE